MIRLGLLISAIGLVIAWMPTASAASASASASSTSSSADGPRATLDLDTVGAGASASGSATATAGGVTATVSDALTGPGQFHGEAPATTSRSDRK